MVKLIMPHGTLFLNTYLEQPHTIYINVYVQEKSLPSFEPWYVVTMTLFQFNSSLLVQSKVLQTASSILQGLIKYWITVK